MSPDSLQQLHQLFCVFGQLSCFRLITLCYKTTHNGFSRLHRRDRLSQEYRWFNLAHNLIQAQQWMSEMQKNVDRKVTRMEHEYQDLTFRTEYLRVSKAKIKKDIEFYKAAIAKLAFIYDLTAE